MNESPKRGKPANEALRKRRCQEILDAAATLFAQNGFARTDIQELALQLNVGKGTIYRYFPSKQELFLASVDRVMLRLQEKVDAAACDQQADPLDLIRGGVRAFLDFFYEEPELIELLIQERAEFRDRDSPTYLRYRQANSGRWRDLLRALIADGRVRKIPVERVVAIMGDLLYGAMFTNYFTGRRPSPERQAAEILDMAFHGLLTAQEHRDDDSVNADHAPL